MRCRTMIMFLFPLLLAAPLAQAKGLLVDDAVADVVQTDGQVVDTKPMGPRAPVHPGPQRGIEGAQRGIVQVGQKVPEQAQIEPGAGGKAQLLLEAVPQLRFRQAGLLPDEGLVEQVDEVQAALELCEKVDRLRQRRADLEDRQPMVDVDQLEQRPEQLARQAGRHRADARAARRVVEL